MLPPDAIFELKIHQNSFAAGALPRAPLRELNSASPDPLAGFQGSLRGRGGNGKKREEEREGRRGRERSPFPFCNLTTDYFHCKLKIDVEQYYILGRKITRRHLAICEIALISDLPLNFLQP